MELSGCGNLVGHREVKIRLAGKMSIFIVEAHAIEAIKITRLILSVTLWPKKRLSLEGIARKWY
jgi:hypothetical protein